MKNPKAEARAVVADYRRRVAKGGDIPDAAIQSARCAYLLLGGDPEPSAFSLKDYDYHRYGPFLGVSDEGTAAAGIRDAAHASPKCRALPARTRLTPDAVGVALDAERLGGIGEVAVGPEEYADVWSASVDRLLITTNIGTRMNVRVYRREPRILLRSDDAAAIRLAQSAIADAFKPFTATPDGHPRPLTVFLDIPRYAKITRPKQVALLARLVRFVASGEAAGQPSVPAGHELGLAAWVPLGLAGRDAALAAIDLAASAGIRVVVIDGVKRKLADSAISLAGLLDYFEPGLVGPILRRAKEKGVNVRAANLPDTDTMARSVWSGLQTARSMGAHLGKYGCFPLTLAETDHVVAQVQRWFADWSAAPAFFMDQGLLRDGAIDVDRDLPRGIKLWLDTVAAHGVRVVLLDTIDKASGRRLLKKTAQDAGGYLGWGQIARIEEHAHKLGVKVLWAGGLGLRETYEMGRRGVFGIYVTSAVAKAIAVPEGYARDPMLPSLKEPSAEAVLRVKTLLEAGFLTTKLPSAAAAKIQTEAEALLQAVEAGDATEAAIRDETLATACVEGWRTHWRKK